MPIYALGDRTPDHPPRGLRPPRRRRHRRRAHRRVVVGVAGRGAARRLRHDRGGRAHVDPGRRDGPRGRRVPHGRRQRLRGRAPRAPRGLRDRGPARWWAAARSCCTAPTVHSGATVGAGAVVRNRTGRPAGRAGGRACPPSSRRARATSRPSRRAPPPTSRTPSGTGATCAASRSSRPPPVRLSAAAARPSVTLALARANPSSRVAASTGDDERQARVGADHVEDRPRLAREESAHHRDVVGDVAAAQRLRAVAPAEHGARVDRAQDHLLGGDRGHAWTAPARLSSSSPSAPLTRMA